MQVWDHTTGLNICTYRGHAGWFCRVRALTWSPDNKYIASASNDKTVQVWDTATGDHIFTYRDHADKVNTVAWSPDGKYIASGSADGVVRVWRAPSDQQEDSLVPARGATTSQDR